MVIQKTLPTYIDYSVLYDIYLSVIIVGILLLYCLSQRYTNSHARRTNTKATHQDIIT